MHERWWKCVGKNFNDFIVGHVEIGECGEMLEIVFFDVLQTASTEVEMAERWKVIESD